MVKPLGIAIVYCLRLLTTGSQSSTQASSPALPLSVTVSQIDSTGRTVTFTVQNTGGKVITAWHVAIVVGSDRDAAHGGYGVDGFRQFEGLGPGQGYILPNGVMNATAKLPQGSDNVSPLVVMPDVAIFADTTFVGDVKSVQWFFDRRRAQLAAWQEIAGALERARTSSTVDERTMELLLSTMDDSIARNGRDIVRQTFRANLSLRLADVRAGRAQAVSTLTAFLQEASENIAAATAHCPR
jgi:hypothetical protein